VWKSQAVRTRRVEGGVGFAKRCRHLRLASNIFAVLQAAALSRCWKSLSAIDA
jgi:hypothetical protein